MCVYIYIQKRRLWGLRFGNPLFSVVLYVSKGCAWVSVSVGRSFGAHACMFLFPTTTSALDCFKPGGLFINTGFVYKHCVSVYRAFSVLGLLDLLVVFYVYYMILNSCLLVLYVLLVVFLFVFINFSQCKYDTKSVCKKPGPTATCSHLYYFGWVPYHDYIIIPYSNY